MSGARVIPWPQRPLARPSQHDLARLERFAALRAPCNVIVLPVVRRVPTREEIARAFWRRHVLDDGGDAQEGAR